MTSKLIIVFGILAAALVSIASSQSGRLFFNIPGLPNLGSIGDLINCQPLNRTLVQQGLPCMQPNATAINCRNQTCVCSSTPRPSMPSLPGAGQLPSLPFPIPTLPPFPGIPGGGMLSPSVWNCTARAANNGTTTTTTLKPEDPSNSTTTSRPGPPGP